MRGVFQNKIADLLNASVIFVKRREITIPIALDDVRVV